MVSTCALNYVLALVYRNSLCIVRHTDRQTHTQPHNHTTTHHWSWFVRGRCLCLRVSGVCVSEWSVCRRRPCIVIVSVSKSSRILLSIFTKIYVFDNILFHRKRMSPSSADAILGKLCLSMQPQERETERRDRERECGGVVSGTVLKRGPGDAR